MRVADMYFIFALLIAAIAFTQGAAAHGAMSPFASHDIPTGKTILSYERLDQRSLSVSIIKKNLAKRITLEAPEIIVDRLVSRVLDGLEADSAAVASPDDLPDFDAEAAHDLFTLLVQPVLGELSGVERLTIAADGRLAALPFDALLSALPSEDDMSARAYTAYPWLRKDFVISRFTRTARSTEGSDRRARATGGLLGFGNPTMPDYAAFGAPALPDANLELAQLRMSLHGRPGKIAVGARASEAGFKRALMSADHLAVLALATHGVPIAGQKSDAILMLSEGDGDDGLLTAEEVQALRFRADLVILSACDSGAETLVRAFIEAGGDQVLALRWPVLSNVARQISTNVVGMTQSDLDLPFDVALWQAVEKLIDSGTSPHYAHPMIWAPFVLTTATA